jgi:tRNA A37 threonylcarbamoyladenosine dehydratase
VEEMALRSFSREELLIGKDALEKLKNSKVAVFGIGGVGSFVVEGLVRSGVGKFVLVDDDLVCITNINRQIHATTKTIGRPKVDVMRERVLDINPSAEVTAIKRFYMPECAMEIIQGDEDYIVDAIDTVTAKLDLIVRAKTLGIPIISAMGAGNKLDPTRFEVTDIYKTSVDPLARVMRRELKQRGIDSLKVVYSREKPVKPINFEKDSRNTEYDHPEGSSNKGKKRQIPGSISFVPSVAGLIIAGEVVKDLIS